MFENLLSSMMPEGMIENLTSQFQQAVEHCKLISAAVMELKELHEKLAADVQVLDDKVNLLVDKTLQAVNNPVDNAQGEQHADSGN